MFLCNGAKPRFSSIAAALWFISVDFGVESVTSEAGPEIVTAALVVIGDEILSGRIPDAKIAYIADHLGKIGIALREVRVVPDREEAIVSAVNALRPIVTYVFTTGGIGPTHDDITTDAIAKAFDVPVDIDP